MAEGWWISESDKLLGRREQGASTPDPDSLLLPFASAINPKKQILNLGSCLHLYSLHSGAIKNDLLITQAADPVLCHPGGHQMPVSRENGREGWKK